MGDPIGPPQFPVGHHLTALDTEPGLASAADSSIQKRAANTTIQSGVPPKNPETGETASTMQAQVGDGLQPGVRPQPQPLAKTVGDLQPGEQAQVRSPMQ